MLVILCMCVARIKKKALVSGCLFIDNTNVGLSGAAQGLVTSYQQALLSSAQVCTYGGDVLLVPVNVYEIYSQYEPEWCFSYK